MRRFHHSQFSDSSALRRLKQAGGRRVSVCIPTLDEAGTIGAIVSSIRENLVDAGVVDELLVIDSGSKDGTRTAATAAGAEVYLAVEIAPDGNGWQGKGENMWKALHVATGDIVCYLDGDMENFHPGFVTGLIGPLLEDESIDYVKAYYDRPLARGEELLTNGGGRVSEILVRPLLALFYPELAVVLQPLAGECAARREVLESLPFPIGYGVEIAHLIDLAAAGRLRGVAQTDLVQRIHRNRGEGELGAMAFAILRVVMRRLERDGKLTLANPLPELYQTWTARGDGVRHSAIAIPEPERPPVLSLAPRE